MMNEQEQSAFINLVMRLDKCQRALYRLARLGDAATIQERAQLVKAPDDSYRAYAQNYRDKVAKIAKEALEYAEFLE